MARALDQLGKLDVAPDALKAARETTGTICWSRESNYVKQILVRSKGEMIWWLK